MKLQIDPKRTIISCIFAAIFAAGIFFLAVHQSFLTWPWNFVPYLVIGVYIVLTTAFFILTLKSSYYILEKKSVIVRRFRKDLRYNFYDIIYIDQEKSEKKRMIYFFTRQGHTRYLTFDKEGLLYKVMLEKCPLMSKEDFEAKYPGVRF